MADVTAFIEGESGGSAPDTTPQAPSGGETAAGVTPAPAPTSAPGSREETSSPPGTQAQVPAGETPANVPYSRFLEVNREKNELKQQLSEFGPYRDLVTALTENGYSPSEAVQAIQAFNNAQEAGGAPQGPPGAMPAGPGVPLPFGQPQQAPTGTPQEQYHAWLEGQGVDPYQLQSEYPLAYQSHQLTWQGQQQMQTFHQQMEQQQMRSAQAELQAEMAQVSHQFPEYQDPHLMRSLVAQYAISVEQGRPVPLEQLAKQQMSSFDVIHQARLARYAEQKAEDRQVPVVTGGGAPPAYEIPDITRMQPEQRRAAAEAYIAASMGGSVD